MGYKREGQMGEVREGGVGGWGTRGRSGGWDKRKLNAHILERSCISYDHDWEVLEIMI